MSDKDPAFLLYTNDFSSGTVDFSPEELGCYFRLLMYQHQAGIIPNKPEKMMRICGVFDVKKWSEIWSEIKKKFKKKGDGFYNLRLEKEINKRYDYAKLKKISASLAGLISANKLTKKQAIFVKQDFDVQDFTHITNNKELKTHIKQWFNQRLTIYEDVNENKDINEDKSISKNNKKGVSKFTKPTIEEIKNYCAERQNQVDPELFFDHYESNGWKVGGRSAMKDWKASVRTWERNDLSKSGKSKPDKYKIDETAFEKRKKLRREKYGSGNN